MYSSMAKGTSWAEATSNSEKIKPVAIAIVELRESEGIRQAVSRSVKVSLNNFFKKFCSNFLKAFRINLKAFLGLVFLTYTATSLCKEFWLVLRWIFFVACPNNL